MLVMRSSVPAVEGNHPSQARELRESPRRPTTPSIPKSNWLARLLLHPHPLRAVTIKIIKKFHIGRYDYRVRIGAVARPHYGHCVYQGALLAKKLGYDRISILECGVAGGNGLLNLQSHAAETSRLLGIDIDIYGFDTGEGLPPPRDYRDLPYQWKEGQYEMDHQLLELRLKNTKLILGDIQETVKRFVKEHNPAPIAAIMHDMDYFSSTAAALTLFDADERFFLPRVFCYFDDVTGDETALYSDYTGERLAINEFNQSHETKKIATPYYLLSRKVVEPWHHRIFIYHDFLHGRYKDFVAREQEQLSLE